MLSVRDFVSLSVSSSQSDSHNLQSCGRGSFVSPGESLESYVVRKGESVTYSSSSKARGHAEISWDAMP